MVEFDQQLQQAKLSLTIRGLSVPLTVSLPDLRRRMNGEHPAGAKPEGGELETCLRFLLRSCERSFKPSLRSVLPLDRQFTDYVLSAYRTYLRHRSDIGPEEAGEFRRAVQEVNDELARKAGIEPVRMREAMSYQYFAGVHHMTHDDDFIAVRKGGLIVSYIALPGNDYNEVKRFIEEARGDVLSVRNVADLKNCIRKVRQQKASDLVRPLASPRRQKAVNEIKR